VRIRRPGTGVLPAPITQEEASCNLEGGLTSVLEGLEDSGRPCAHRLSVAGLLAILALFPLGEEFIPEVRKASFIGETPTRVDVPARTAFTRTNMMTGP